jgi:Tol biopolymer transport system component
MKQYIWFILGVMAFAPSAHAEDLLDWLQTKASDIQHTSNAVKLKDNAELLTLEPGENEMYPKVSPDGKTMLVVSGKRRKAAITLRLIENGDPLNVVSENDELALTSYAWYGHNHVSFLSRRAGGLGVWEKPAGGQGAIRRLYRLIGDVADPVVLDDGSLIAVRLFAVSNQKYKVAKQDGFSNWKVSGMQAHLVHISREGAENDLAAGVNPAVSPDGRQLAFSMRAGRSRHLFMMNVDGSDLVQLTDERSIDVQPAWSPDGKWIVFTSNRGRADMRQPKKSNWDIWAIGRDGRNLMQLTHDKARDGAPDVGAGGRVYFHSDRKVGSEKQKAHQVKGSTSGFHIWSVNLPAGLS